MSSTVAPQPGDEPGAHHQSVSYRTRVGRSRSGWRDDALRRTIMDLVSNTFQSRTGRNLSRRQLLQRALVFTGAAMLPARHLGGFWSPSNAQAATAGYSDLH